MKMGAGGCPKTLVAIYKTGRRHIPEYYNLEGLRMFENQVLRRMVELKEDETRIR
jgi:hypothetical protein